jgi:dihydrofolate synthase/folylpolyglutamate synthase
MHISDEAVREGLRAVRWPARFERLREADPILFYDGSHNPQGITSAVQTVKTYFPNQRVTVLTGVMRDKNYETMIDSIQGIAHRVFTVTPSNPRSLPAEDYAAHFRAKGVAAEASATVAEGVQKAIAYAKATASPLICLGSLYLYGELSEAVQIELP